MPAISTPLFTLSRAYFGGKSQHCNCLSKALTLCVQNSVISTPLMTLFINNRWTVILTLMLAYRVVGPLDFLTEPYWGTWLPPPLIAWPLGIGRECLCPLVLDSTTRHLRPQCIYLLTCSQLENHHLNYCAAGKVVA